MHCRQLTWQMLVPTGHHLATKSSTCCPVDRGYHIKPVMKGDKGTGNQTHITQKHIAALMPRGNQIKGTKIGDQG